MNQLSVDEFLGLMLEVPDIEAEQEIVLRREALGKQVAEMQQVLKDIGKTSARAIEIGHDLQILNQDFAKLKNRLSEVRRRQERINWGNAVRALFGEDGYCACREWMEVNAGALS